MMLSKLSGSQQGHPRGRVPPFLCRGAIVAVAPVKSCGVKETTGLAALGTAAGMTGDISLPVPVGGVTTSVAFTVVEEVENVITAVFKTAADIILTFVTPVSTERVVSDD